MNIQIKNSQYRRSRYLIIALLCLQNITQAQTPVPLQTPYSNTIKVNYIRTWDALAPEQTPANLPGRNLQDVRQTTAWFDGLGRPIQTVVKKGSLVTNPANPTSSAGAVDLVSAVVYDEFSREQRKYLPFGANNAGSNPNINDGLFKLNPFQQQAQFYNTQLTGQPGETNVGPNSLNWAYGQTNFEASPLNRVQENFAPGAAWVGSAWQTPESNHYSIKTKYLFNTITDSVKIWTVTDVANNWGSYAVTGMYKSGELNKNITVDEVGKQIIEFKDKHGQIILKKVQASAPTHDDGTGSGYTGWLCTYYVYDDLDNMRLVIQPKGVELLAANSWNTTWSSSVILNEQCFRYEYDIRRRMSMKKVPGTGEVWMVYDKWDRLVLTQDANLRPLNRWIFTKYDAFNRPIMTGFFNNATYVTQSTMQGNLTSQNLARFEVVDLTKPYAYTTNLSFPSTGNPDPQIITHYDNYDWVAIRGQQISATRITTYDSYLLPVNGNYPYAEPMSQSSAVKGLVTGTFVRILGTNNYINTVNIYDEKGRIIQTQSNNISGAGTDVISTQYSFSNQPLVVISKSAFTAHTNIVASKFTYDDLGRLLTTSKTVNSTIRSQAVNKPEQVIVRNEYDALGQLKKKLLAPTASSGAEALETLTYDYNIRGWTLGANRKYLLDQSTGAYTENYFGFELGYNNTVTTPGSTSFSKAQFNGNIAGTIWKSKGDAVRRKYDFDYDVANRFGKATFIQNTSASGGAWNTSDANFSVHGFDADNDYMMKYDANGNILNMIQHGIKPGSTDMTIDALRYTYYDNSNKLKKVVDDLNDNNSKLGDFKYDATSKSATADYGYDPNGNLVTDQNKKIGTTIGVDLTSGGGITYNYLNLPQSIAVTGKGTIQYTYDAAGNKLRKVVTDPTVSPTKVTTTTYLAGAVYENDTLQFIGHEEGRLRYTKKRFVSGDSAYQFQYDYFLKDHLGNVRMVLTEQSDTTRYLASMETATRTKEDQLFYNISLTAVTKSSVSGGYPTDPNPVTVPNDLVAKLNGSGNKLGPALVLKVMSGDKVDIGVSHFYRSGGSANEGGNPLTDILTSLATGIVGVAGESKGTLTALSNGTSSPLLGALGSFRSGNNPSQATKPKAYLNWILLDEQLKYVAASSGAIPVSDANLVKAIASTGIPMTKNGFLYIYVSNETQNWDVFFDNLSIQHTTGPITEETHYYPFGLTMAGISSRAIKAANTENKKKFNGIEHNTDFDLNMYDAFYRNLDPQIGRFWQVDPKAIDEISPYAAMLNNPITLCDPLGDTTSYYDVKGNLLYTTNVKGYRNAFIVNNDHLDAAKELFSGLGNDLGSIGQFLVDALFAVANGEGKVGDAYDLQSISNFYETNEAQGSLTSIDGISIDKMNKIEINGKTVSGDYIKSLKGAEYTALMKKNSGVWTISQSSVQTINDATRSLTGGKDPYAHIHNYIPQLLGKTLTYSFKATYGVAYGVIGPINKSQVPSSGNGDVGLAKDEGKVGNGTKRNIVVNYSDIWFYSGDGIGFKVNRK